MRVTSVDQYPSFSPEKAHRSLNNLQMMPLWYSLGKGKTNKGRTKTKNHFYVFPISIQQLQLVTESLLCF